MGQEMRVDPAALSGQAGEMKGRYWPDPADPAAPPDTLPSTGDAIANLNANAEALQGYQKWAEAENSRIAEMLEIAAEAYKKVDDTYGRALENPERKAAIDAIPVPAPATPAPELPSPPSAPKLLSANGYSDVPTTQQQLLGGDQAATLKAAMVTWGLAAKRVADNAPHPPSGDWEGAAAEAAYERMTKFGSWLQQLSQSWHGLAEAASQIIDAHEAAKSTHSPIASEYELLDAQMKALASQISVGNAIEIQQAMELVRKRMEELQKESDEVREEYAKNATFAQMKPADPPGSGSGGPAQAPGGGGGGAPGGGTGGGGGGQPTGDPAGMAQKMGSSLGGPTAGAGQPAGAGKGSGAEGGAPAGGGAPSGGAGAGSGGGAPGGAPSTGMPKLPTDPSLRPAASGADSGGSGSGGGGGGGGGGMPATPMSAAVTAETVAPAPTTPSTAGAAPAASGSGAGIGGMGGGMAPMHGAGGQQGGKEKRRDPKLAPDEELYVEDRPWTEGVIGNRRRREVQDGKDAK